MYITTVKYENYDGEPREMECHFQLSEAEVVELEVSWDGGLKAVLERIIQEHDQKRMVEMMKMLILKSYGKKSLDGNRFVKNQEIIDEFTQTPAYSELFMMLSTDADVAADFVNGIIPKKLNDRLKALEENGKIKTLPGQAPVAAEVPKA